MGTVVDWFAQRMNFVADRPAMIKMARGEKTTAAALLIHERLWDVSSKSRRAN